MRDATAGRQAGCSGFGRRLATRAWLDAGPGWPDSVLRRRRRRSEHMTASPGIPRARIVPPGRTRDSVTTPPPHPRRDGAAVDHALWAQVTRYARCADSGLDPDQWFPVSVDPTRGRQEAAAAIAVCAGC